VDIKEFLEYIIFADKRIKNKQAEIYQLYCLATSTTAPMGSEAVQTSGVSDKVGNAATKILQEKEKAERMVKEYVEERAKRIALIEKLENPLEYDVIHLHYVQDKSLKDIATEVCKSYQYIVEIHNQALKNLSKHIESYV
jgi:DNA-directed RNA polymerase specialized sigma subunit